MLRERRLEYDFQNHIVMLLMTLYMDPNSEK